MKEKPKILFVPVASKLHEKKIFKATLEMRKILERKLDVLGPKKLVLSLKDFSRVKVKDFDLGVVFVGSGGASKTITNIASNKDWFIVAYDENNSLPSALSAKEKMVSMGKWRGKIVYTNLQEEPKDVVYAAYGFKALKTLKKVRIGVFGAGKNTWEKIKFTKKYFGVKVKVFPLKKLFSTLKEKLAENVEDELKRRLGEKWVCKVSREDLVKAFRFYLAMKKVMEEEGLDCITFDCFKYLKSLGGTPCLPFSLLNDENFLGVCENEVSYAPLMFIMREISGKPVWLANLAKVDFQNNTVLLTHCTAATKLSGKDGKVILKPHFESGLGVSLDVPLGRGFVTLAHLRLKPPTLIVVEGEILRSQLGLKNECRSQAYVRLDGDVKRFFEETGNHHVVGYGLYGLTLALISEKIGLKPLVLGLYKQ
ncbi:MAG: hypothetical protein DRO36_00410 [Candidatus Hecatellales archaeon]|nr:MAG: hypothetical protein DRO36_00410 [Candidatus Hecatellales archaeon]